MYAYIFIVLDYPVCLRPYSEEVPRLSAANKSNKHSRTADKGSFSSLGFDEGLKTPVKYHLFTKCYAEAQRSG
jgi:hypothetical protein